MPLDGKLESIAPALGGVKRCDARASVPQLSPIALRQRVAANLVIDEVHVHASLRPLDEGVLQSPAEPVVTEPSR